MFFDKLFKKKNKEIKWYSAKKVYPEENQRIVVIDVDGDVYTGNFTFNVKENQRIVSMAEFIGMPFLMWSEIKYWAKITEFRKVK